MHQCTSQKNILALYLRCKFSLIPVIYHTDHSPVDLSLVPLIHIKCTKGYPSIYYYVYNCVLYGGRK